MAAPFKTRLGVITSVGAADAGKIPVLDADGKISDSMLPFSNFQAGSASAPNTGTKSTTQTVMFPTVFTSTPFVFPVLRQASITASGVPGTIAVTAITPTYFTVVINVNDDDTSGSWDINTSPNFDWWAVQL